MDINEHFDSLAGRPDFWWIDADGTCHLVDLKTSAKTNPRQYFYSAMDFHYDSQLALYRYLLKELHPEIKRFQCYNLVVSKQREVYGVELYLFPEHILDRAEKWSFKLIEAIGKETEYKKYNPSFTEPALFGDFESKEDVE